MADVDNANGGEWLALEFNAARVTLSVLVSLMGALAAVELNETRRFETNAARRRKLALAVAAVVGTSAIWCMHFVGMSALELQAPRVGNVEMPPLLISYRLDLTFASWAAAVLMQVIGVSIVALKDPFFSATDHDAALELIRGQLIAQPLKNITDRKPTHIVATIQVQWIILGGFISGLGASTMHFLGLFSQVVDAELSPSVGFIVLAVLLAVTAATAAFWILFRLPLLYWDSLKLRLSSATLMTLAVCSMHYTGMYGMKYQFAPGRATEGHGDHIAVDTETEALVAILISITVFASVMMWLLVQLRAEMAVVAREKSTAARRSQGTKTKSTSNGLLDSAVIMSQGAESTRTSNASKYCFKNHKTLGRRFSSQLPPAEETHATEMTTNTCGNNGTTASNGNGTSAPASPSNDKGTKQQQQQQQTHHRGSARFASVSPGGAAATMSVESEKGTMLNNFVTTTQNLESNDGGAAPGRGDGAAAIPHAASLV